MVHRAPDSRLLTNLIVHEKEYVKHLAGLFPLSHSALASLSAYAVASPTHPSSPAQSIAAVVDVLASANDALQRYNQVVEAWREQLVCLKDLEDDLSAILRDRDILVTRLIRASRTTRDAHRSSRLMSPLTSLGSPSLSSLPSTNSTTPGSVSGPPNTNTKLAQAQAELQACEAHLVAKEHELEARRISIARDGLGARCRALVDCGWVWGEMGKQGLKALQALGTNNSDHMAASTSTPAMATHASDNSSLTPSQSASQIAARSVETSHEASTSKEHAHTEPKAERTSQARAAHTEKGDFTVTLPPAHAISELILPTGVRSQPSQNGDLAVQNEASPDTTPPPAVPPKRKHTKRPRRPPSQHISEVSDEGSDGPSSTSNRNGSANVTASTTLNLLVPRTVFPSANAAAGGHDTSSEDIGPFEVVENDPFELIRKSIVSPSASAPFLPTSPSVPSALTSASDVRGHQTSLSKTALPNSGSAPESALGTGLPPGSGPAKRERRTSIAFFGSIRGLFRKPKDRDLKITTEWDEDHSSPTPSPGRGKGETNEKAKRGWVTRTDARIKESRGGAQDSDDETTPVAGVTRRASGRARLRKGRPGVSTRGIHENGSTLSIPVVPSHRAGAGVDGWITDGPVDAGVGSSAGAGTGQGTGVVAGRGKLRTPRGTMKRKKISVAELRGSDQGHTDGEVDDRVDRRRSLERAANKESEGIVSGSKPEVEVDVEDKKALSRHGTISKAVPTGINPTADPDTNTSADPTVQHKRSATTMATLGRKAFSDGTSMHRRSASLSLIHVHAASVSTSTEGAHTLMSTGKTVSWRKPPPQVEPPSQPESWSQPQTPSRSQTESQPKQNARRLLGNGHASHPHKHVQSQSLMSIVADVTRLNERDDRGRGRDRELVGVGADRARSLDIPRAPGSVLREVDPVGRGLGQASSNVERETGTRIEVNGRGHAKQSSSPSLADEGGRRGAGQVGQGQGRGQSEQRPIKSPLRSALRNASRTPSPSPASIPVPAPVTVPAAVATRSEREAKRGVVQADVEPVQTEEDRGLKMVPSPLKDSALRDSASISSYETGRETFDAEDGDTVLPTSPSPHSHVQSLLLGLSSPVPRSQSPTPRARTPPPLSFTFPPPPVEPPPVSVSIAAQGDVTQNSSPNGTEQPPSSNVSTETPVRRKSVRVSLPPTFSSTPPALFDEDGEEHAPWSKSFSVRDEGEKEKEKERRGRDHERRNSRGGRRRGRGNDVQEDMWADSSEEDEEYSRAKRLLSLVGKSDKGKARAKT